MSEPTPDPFIHPFIVTVAALVQSGKATGEDLAKPYPMQWPRVPHALLPFVQSPNLATLAEVLTSHPALYWHPLVYRQMLYLLRLRYDEGEWLRLGWGPQYDEDGYHWPPAEVTTINQWLERLVDTHVSGLFPDKRLHGIRQRRKRGPKGQLRNRIRLRVGPKGLTRPRLMRISESFVLPSRPDLQPTGRPCLRSRPKPKPDIEILPKRS